MICKKELCLIRTGERTHSDFLILVDERENNFQNFLIFRRKDQLKNTYGNYKYVLSLVGILGAFSLSGINTAVIQSVAQGYEGALAQGFRLNLKYSAGIIGLSLALAFVTGNMFLGLFGSDVGIRLAAGDLEGLVALGGGPFGPAGRPMGGYVSLPAAWRGKPAKNTTWVAKALDHVGAMPPKAPKGRKGPARGR